jgi:Na+/melibiose symporter-like transporter
LVDQSPASAKAPRPKLGRPFQNLFASNLATNLGDGIIRTAAPLLAVTLTSDPLLISLIAAMALLPWLFFAIPAGILIDRIDRRVALRIANGSRVVLAVGLVALYWTDTLSIGWLCLVVFIDGTAETIYDGAIRAMVPSVVQKELLPSANSRIEGGELVLQQFVAAPVTSYLFAIAVLIPLSANIFLYALAVVLAFLLPKAASGTQFTQVAGEPRVAWYKQFVDGYHFIMSNKMLRTLWFVSTFVGLCFSAATSSFVLFLFKVDGLPHALYGTFLLSGAVGGVLGSFGAAWLKKRIGAGPTMALANLVAALAVLFVGLVPSIWAAAAGFFVVSGAVLIWNVLIMSLRQSIIPGRLLGRVHGTWRTLLWGTMPLGALIGGLLGRVNLALPFIVGGAGSLIVSLIFYRFFTRLPNPEDVDNGDEAPMVGPAGMILED